MLIYVCLCRDGVRAGLGNGLRYPNPPRTECEPTFLLCVLDVCALSLPRDTICASSSPDYQQTDPGHTPRLCAPLPRLARPSLLPPVFPCRPLCVFTTHHPRSPPDRRLSLRSQVDLSVAPQNHRPRIKHRPIASADIKNARHWCST